MALKTYDPADMQIVIAGIIVDGFADGTFLNIVQNNDAFNLAVGSGGEGARAKSNDRSARITFTLLQTAAANAALAALHQLDLNSSNGLGIGPLLIKDGQGLSIYAAQTAWITKAPDAEFGKEITNREWIIETERLENFTGGN